MKLRLFATILAMLASTSGARAQAKNPPETKNAALLYLTAFAEMQEPAADKATQELLRKTLAGETAWNETELGPILDANTQSIRTMQQATNLPECDWGPEYSEGLKATAAYMQARALARLNTLEGIRQMASGDSQTAVNTWLAGIHFSQDVTHGRPIISVLIAKQLMLPNLRVLTEESKKGELNEEQIKQVYAAVRDLPEDGLDWRGAWRAEYERGERFLEKWRSATNPRAEFKALAGIPAPKKGFPPTTLEIQAFREYMLAVQAALRESPEKAKTLLDGLESKRRNLGELEQNLIPDPQKLNAARTEVVTERTALMQALVSK
ncbi:MAG TPA: hypothetical protein VJO53_12145 [Candidatus Acidoferrales bacterium]|nr:hypothetical protein [Candidatus Acidoferrales bacterium]